MKKVAYRLQPHDDLREDIQEYLYDIDEDFLKKTDYIKRAKVWTDRVNQEFKTNYNWTELFPQPTDLGWRYCTNCDEFYWKDDYCDCEC